MQDASGKQDDPKDRDELVTPAVPPFSAPLGDDSHDLRRAGGTLMTPLLYYVTERTYSESVRYSPRCLW